jgi:nicotinate-nucleotide adenylyltransferase
MVGRRTSRRAGTGPTPNADRYNTAMRLGLFGGSFDPVHYGHLLLAEACREQCRLDELWFVPAAVPPHKQDRPLTAAKHRVEMLKLAIGGHEAFSVSTLEIDRGGVSYTVSTLDAIHAERPEAALFFPMGADSLADLPTWREPRRICELAIPIVVRRAGSPEPDLSGLASLVTPERLIAIEKAQLDMPVIELSSTDIRQRVAAGRSIRFRTPRAVEKYIETQGLYRGE